MGPGQEKVPTAGTQYRKFKFAPVERYGRLSTLIKKLFYGLIACLALSTNPILAEDEPPPTPDLWPTEIIAPDGIVMGPNNQIKVIITNLVKDSEVNVPVKIELVVIQAESGERASYFAEVEGMKHNQKREALFTGIAATNSDSVKLLAIIDPEKVIEEANEVNNRRLYQVWIKKAPSASPEAEGNGEPETVRGADSEEKSETPVEDESKGER